MTIAMSWAPGVIIRPVFFDTFGRFLRANWIFMVPILTLVVMFRLWNARGRDPARLAVTPQYKAAR
jgi:hypothetical protein